MAVYAVVPAENVLEDPFVMCFGATNTTLFKNEVLLGCPDVEAGTRYVVTRRDGRLLTHDEWVGEGRPDVLRHVGVSGVERELFPRLEEVHDYMDAQAFFYSTPLLASLTLGTSGGSWTRDDETGDTYYWLCSVHDLTDAGQELVRSLRRLYGRPVWLLTWLDT